MKPISETHALEKLHEIKSDFAMRIRRDYEHSAKSCATCETPGACCLDAHFVNVHISRLEAVAIRKVVDDLSTELREKVLTRIDRAIETYQLKTDSDNTYACPLFEKGIGCLVHDRGKPLPCIAHACYEKKEDLPPDSLLVEREALVDRLNEAVYKRPATWMSLPLALVRND